MRDTIQPSTPGDAVPSKCVEEKAVLESEGLCVQSEGTVTCSLIQWDRGGWDLLTPLYLWSLLEGNHILMSKWGLTSA